jgi:alanine racemase
MHSDSLFHVDLAAIARNAAAFSRLVGPPTVCCGVVKSDAYGLGARPVAETLTQAGMPLVAVFRVEEALDLLSSPLGRPVLILGAVRSLCPMHPLMPSLASGDVQLVVHDLPQLKEIGAVATPLPGPLQVHVMVDAGMRRGGCPPSEAPQLVEAAMQMPGIGLAGLMTHFTSAGTDAAATRAEQAVFSEIVDRIGRLPEGCRVHAAATAATVRDPAYHQGMVRIGLGWVGCIPGDEALSAAFGSQLSPAVRWRSSLRHVHHVQEGHAIGYGQRWRAKRDTRVGIVPVGYADGIPLAAGACDGCEGARIAVVSSAGERIAGYATVIGAVSMDQIAIDLGDLPEVSAVEPGRAVEIISATHEGPTTLRNFAAACGITPHQLLASIGPRVRRVLVNREETVSQTEAWHPAAAV